MAGVRAFVALLPVSLAMRSQDLEMEALGLNEQAGAGAMLSFSGNPGSICGGAGIWQLLTQSVTGEVFDDARNVQWGTIESMKESHLEDGKAKVALLEERLAKLKGQLETALKSEALPSTEAAEHTQFITAAVGPGGYGDVETAKSIKCGMVRKVGGKRISREVRTAFENSKPIFAQAAKDFFAQKTHRLDGMGFLSTCKELLVIEPEEHHYCAQLCQEYKDLAQSASSSFTGEVAAVSNKLKNEIEEVQQELAQAKAAIAQCNVDWESLDDFKAFITELKKTYEDRHEVFRKAQSGLRDAEDQLVDLEDAIEEQEQKLHDLDKDVKESEIESEGLRDLISKTGTTLRGNDEDIKDLEVELGEVSRRLASAIHATDLINRLKEKVAAVMMLMMQFADAGLREPLANLGFSEDPEDLEFAPAGSTEDAPVLQEAVASLNDFCSSTAMPAFDLVKQKLGDLDLSPLCNIKDTPTVYQDLLVQVDKRMLAIKDDMRMVVSWLNPWRVHKGKSMKEAEAMEDNLVKEGQLASLEQVKGIYTEPPNAWFKYLIGWRKNGPHHKLFAELEAVVEELKALEKELSAKLEQMFQKFEASKAQAANLEAALQEAIVNEDSNKELRDKLFNDLEDLKSQQQKVQAAFDDWKNKVDAARAALEAARAALVAAYTEFTTDA